MRALPTLAVAVALGLASVTPAFADREPTPDERRKIETALRAAGYVSWDEIELDDDVWEVDDARKTEGGEDCNLELSPTSLEILETDC